MKRSVPTRPPAAWRRAAAWLGAGWIALGPAALQAAPEGERVRRGQADFEREGDTTHITTHSDRTVIDYRSFDIETHETVRIDQPRESSRTLNRVFSSDPTLIDGWLVSNGGVWIANPAGVFFGGESVVDVGSLVAGAGRVSTRDFMRGELRFRRLEGELSVARGARIQAADTVLLAGRKVANFGHIAAPGGMVALVAGDSVHLLRPGGAVRVIADARGATGSATDAGLVHGGTIDAGDGHVSLVAGDAWSLAMNREGLARGGEIHVEGGDGSRVDVAGTLDASRTGPGETGGTIRVLGEDLSLASARLDASGAAGGGEILVGGDYQGGGETRTAWRTAVGEDVVLRADALEAGDGGRIIVWADGATAFRGALSARGGAAGGDGGFAEISGKQALVSRGEIDLSAPAGEVGTVLYDPLHIVILGGTADGSDMRDDELDLRGDGGRKGRIRFRDTGDGDGIVPFEIYESEIEKTDANIILLAERSIRTEGTFDGDDVVIWPGRSLELEVRDDGGDLELPDFVGIDIRSSDGGDLTWIVSEGGSIAITTTADADREGGADILVGTLVATNAPGDAVSTISIATEGRGDVEVGAIDARGLDAEPDGDVGGSGGAVAIRAAQGTVTVGTIDVSGGAGRLEEADRRAQGRGGAGGSISITADPFVPEEGGGGAPPPTILVTGDLWARGGDGLGSLTDAGQVFGAPGGTGGRVLLSAGLATEPEGDGSIEVVGAIDASGGDGTAGGGNTSLGAVSPQTGALTGAIRLEAHSDVTAGDLRARGGDAGVKEAAEPVAGGFGGVGGAVTLSSATGDVTGVGSADVGGGAGFAEEVVVEGDGDVRFAGQGGAAGSLGVDAAGDGSGVLLAGNVLARGGDGVLGSGGAGGSVTLFAADGPISLAAIDVGGGSGSGFADGDDGAREASGALGGNGGNVIATTTSAAGGGAEGGDITVTGDIRSLGGAGVDPDDPLGDEDPRENHGVGGLVRLDASLSLVGAGAPTLRAGTVDVSGALDVTGLALAASGDASPESFADRATVRAGGTGTVTLDEDADGADTRFDFAEAVARGTGAALDVTSDDGSTRLAGSGGGATHTVTDLVSADDDPHLSYRLGGPPDERADQVDARTLAVADGAVDLGQNGGAVVNARVDASQLGGERLLGPVAGAVPGAGLETRGTLELVGTRVEDLSVDGSGADARLQLRVGGDVAGLSVGSSLASLALEQRAADSDVAIALPGGDGVEIEGSVFDDGASRIESSSVTRVDTTASGIDFFYDLSDETASSNDPGRGEPVLALEGPVTLGGDGGFAAAGDLVLATTVDATMGAGAVALIADSNGDGEGGLTTNGGGVLDVDGASALHVGSGEGVGSEAAPLRTRAGGPELTLAGLAAAGDFWLVNEAGDLVLSETEIAGLDSPLALGSASALRAGGSVDLENGGRTIAFGPSEDGDARPHVVSGEGQRYGGSVLLANPTEVETVDPVTGDLTTEMRNDVLLVAGGDVVFEGGIDTAQAQLDAGLPGSLDVRSGGTTRFRGDVGRDEGGAATLESLAVDDALFEGDRSVTVARADFRGRLDGTGELVLRGLGDDSQLDFGGDVGSQSAPTRFDADADLLRFTGADRLTAGDVHLNTATPSATVPDLATIADTGGGLRIRSDGDVHMGAREKLSVAGPVQIRAGGEAHFSDLSATEIRVVAERIVVQGREPGLVQLAKGEQSGPDRGVDWVANTIRTNVQPEWDGGGTAPTLVLGAGGLRMPGGPPFEAIRVDDAFSAIEVEQFAGVNGTLDLFGTGPRVVPDPGSDVPRRAGPAVAALAPRTSDTQPVLADPPGAQQVLDFVRCRTPEGEPCDPVRVASAAPESALETERAREVVQRYHDLVASERGRMALVAAFAPLADAPPGDPDALLRALGREPGLAAARERLAELATVLAQISLLGLEEDDAHAVRRALAADFAASTGIAALDADAALTAAEATGVGRLP